jgi:hypothetical protein
MDGAHISLMSLLSKTEAAIGKAQYTGNNQQDRDDPFCVHFSSLTQIEMSGASTAGN